MSAIDTVVFDLGGVLIAWDPRRVYRDLLADGEIDDFLDEIGFFAWNHECDAGLAWDDAVAALSARHPRRSDLIAAYPARFQDSLAGPVEGAVEILRELRASTVALYALTNWSAESFRHARERFAFLEWFRGIVVSGEERVAKPDPRIFAILVDRYRLDPAKTLYVDDAELNVAAARAVGMTAVHFTGAEALREELVALGLLPALSAPTGPGGAA